MKIQNRLLRTILDGISDAAVIWRDEMRQVFKDEGVIIFFFIVPLVYPLLYSWIYNNEVVRDMPVVVVDDSHSKLSRQFIRMCDASPDVKVVCYASDLDEAKMLVGRQVAHAVYYIPSDFQTRLNRMEQSVIGVYCDMSLMLAYKASYQTAVLVSQEMNSEIQIKLSGHYTAREEEIQAKPLDYDGEAIFSPGGGYGSFILPAVLILILQQTLVLGIGLSAGTARESNRFEDLVPMQRHYHGTFRIVLGKSMCYLMIYILMGAWLTVVVPRIFHFPCLAHWQDLLAIMTPYTLACIFFGITVSCIVRYRENVMLLMVFVSVPLLFLSGVSWPQNNIPGFWQGVSWLFPSTFGVRAYIRLNSMGGTLTDVLTEYRILWLHVLAYFTMACIVYRHQIHLSRQHAIERLELMKNKKG
ncbi:ABC-2 type transport system permease protein [Prevotellaceae bacterium MN60]|nr:ABC-2 type transport system permease protein [Prevotellaceae bacterium MN60]